MPCASCGKDDHQRASSSKCINRKRRIRESELATDQEVQVYTVKCGLNTFICPLLDQQQKTKLLSEIRRDVRDLSSLTVELSYLINYFYKTYAKDSDFLERYKKLDALAFTYLLKNVNYTKLSDPKRVFEEYKRLRGSDELLYNCKLRSFTIMAVAKQYETIFENNLLTHAFARIKRYLRFKFKLDKKLVHDAVFKAYYLSEYNNDNSQITDWLREMNITQKSMKKNCWQFVPLFVRMQEELFEANETSFAIFPIYKQGLKFISYDSRGLHELLRRLFPKETASTWQLFSENTKQYWSRYFNVNRNFGYSFCTDGESACISMNRIIKKISTTKKKKLELDERKSTYNRIIAVDPGAKTPIVTCQRDAGRFTYKILKKEKFKHDTLEGSREKKRKRYIGDIEEKIKTDREEFNKRTDTVLSAKSALVSDYTEFQLKWFFEKQKIYSRRALQRLKFDKYTNDQKTIEKIVTDYFGREPNTLVVYGAGYDFMNKATFKGHRKFRHNDVLKAIKRRPNLSLYIIGEAYTTKNCSKCYESNATVNRATVSKSPHRYVYCSICRKGIHRDKNGAKNILLKYEFNNNKLPSILSCTGNDIGR